MVKKIVWIGIGAAGAPEQVFESGTWQFQTSALYDTGILKAGFIAGTKGDSSSV